MNTARTFILACANGLVLVLLSFDGSGRELTDRPPQTIAELFAEIPYEPENALGSGYAARETGDKTYEISVTGAPATPLARLVAIAYARAAEIGVERNWASFRVSAMKRTATCNDQSAAGGNETLIFGGLPKLVVSTEYEPETGASEVRKSAETFAEMRGRLDQMTTSEKDKQDVVDWVFKYCASTGLKISP